MKERAFSISFWGQESHVCHPLWRNPRPYAFDPSFPHPWQDVGRSFGDSKTFPPYLTRSTPAPRMPVTRRFGWRLLTNNVMSSCVVTGILGCISKVYTTYKTSDMYYLSSEVKLPNLWQSTLKTYLNPEHRRLKPNLQHVRQNGFIFP